MPTRIVNALMHCFDKRANFVEKTTSTERDGLCQRHMPTLVSHDRWPGSKASCGCRVQLCSGLTNFFFLPSNLTLTSILSGHIGHPLVQAGRWFFHSLFSIVNLPLTQNKEQT
jgi:hypothetical protein